MLQLSATLEKHYLEKRRNIRVSCCECCSHLIIIVVLIFGYQLSKVLYYGAAKYDSYEIRIPPNFVVSPQDAKTSGRKPNSIDFGKIISSFEKILDGPIIVPTFDEFFTVNNLISGNVNSGISSLFLQLSFGQKFG